jgi:hypothetical protein
MPPSLFSPYTPRVGTQILLTDLHYPGNGGFFIQEVSLAHLRTS